MKVKFVTLKLTLNNIKTNLFQEYLIKLVISLQIWQVILKILLEINSHNIQNFIHHHIKNIIKEY